MWGRQIHQIQPPEERGVGLLSSIPGANSSLKPNNAGAINTDSQRPDRYVLEKLQNMHAFLCTTRGRNMHQRIENVHLSGSHYTCLMQVLLSSGVFFERKIVSQSYYNLYRKIQSCYRLHVIGCSAR